MDYYDEKNERLHKEMQVAWKFVKKHWLIILVVIVALSLIL